MSERALEERVLALMDGVVAPEEFQQVADEVGALDKASERWQRDAAHWTDMAGQANHCNRAAEATIAKLKGVLQALEITRRDVDGMDVISVGRDQLCGNDPDFPTSEGYVEVAAWLDAEDARKNLEDTDE